VVAVDPCWRDGPHATTIKRCRESPRRTPHGRGRVTAKKSGNRPHRKSWQSHAERTGRVTEQVRDLGEANNPQQSWGFEGKPPEAVMKDLRILVRETGLHEDASFNCI